MYKKLIFIIFALNSLTDIVSADEFLLPRRYIGEVEKSTEDVFIIGGKEVDIKDYPYQAAIHMFNHHFCGGVIVSDKAIVTAAHCVSAYHESILSVRVGSSKTHEGGVYVGIISRHIHPDFNKSPADFDIAVVILEKKLNFSNVIKPIELQMLPLFPGELASVSGWGKTEDSQTAENLRAVDLRIVNQRQCFQNYCKAGYNLTERMLCAGIPNGGSDACVGDSGGPLICRFGNKLCGIVSFGKGCALNGFPGIYTKISSVRNWIMQFL